MIIIRRAYELLVTATNFLQSPLLLALRVYFFWQLFLTGKGKLSNIGKVSEFFTSLGIPLPTLNAYFIGSLECFGSLLLIIGLASRPLSLLIVISMTVAYLAADFEAVSNIFSDPDKFVKADPFPFLLTALIILVFGPGLFSIDALMKQILRSEKKRNWQCSNALAHHYVAPVALIERRVWRAKARQHRLATVV
jgi:putative oxidoreductase